MTHHNMFTPIFEAQRNAITQQQEMMTEAVDLQRRGFDAWIDMVEASGEFARSQTEAGRTISKTTLEAMAANVQHDAVDAEALAAVLEDGFDATGEVQEAMVEAYVEAIQESATQYDEFATESLEFFEQGVTASLEAHEELEEVVDTTVSEVEETVEEATGAA